MSRAEDPRRAIKHLVEPLYGKLNDHLNLVKRNEVVSPVEYMMKSMEQHEKQKNDHSKRGLNETGSTPTNLKGFWVRKTSPGNRGRRCLWESTSEGL